MDKEKIRILYVDDELNNLNMFRASFRLDYDIVTSLSGKDALEQTRKSSFHVVIADQRMPEMSGVEFFEKLLEEDPEPVRILLTGYTNIESVIDAINRGQVFRYIKKPWEEDDLRLTIENAYEIYYTRQALKRKNEELAKMNADLMRANEELNRFVYSASHDLKAPLASIMGIVQVARMEGEEHEAAHYLSLIERSVKQLETFIQNIIDYYKNIRYQENLVEINFDSLIQETIDSFQYYQNISEIDFDISVQQSTTFINDDFRMRVIFNNLVSNAIKYQKKKTTDKKINIHVRTADGIAVIHIRDNGIGIPDEYIKDIYKMFFRATEVSAGSGMGLYIVKEAIEKMHGQISVASKEGEGTAFTVVLPNRN
ncbi:hybrid sensor histidine kinase/response regulator [Xanthocytophaga agilis]|uniref:histidine kinase n=1 Tax=Xanthocytophaga agilis TaxID=3048010 RepID=A0AAE3R894_9BACT|nr:hybrid sensor histidine kinase/response regulator [Xanthocytophaga agilis]MDJ1502597.1 hybrid sensor histidine kinase/response regulator [Xanthocytophaga agilis]